jgi:nitroreductase/NAD-dependent dihydropyrimidine dehydrogenase PreA subunit
METIKIDNDKCILCGSCADVCVQKILNYSPEAINTVSPERCILCGHCKAVCPENAIEFPSLNSQEFIPVPDKESFPSPDSLLNFFRYRRSTRKYKEIPVEKAKIEKIIEAGRFAPTGGNLQALRYVVANTPEKIDEIRGIAIDGLIRYANDINNKLSIKEKSGKSFSIADTIQQNYARMLRDMKSSANNTDTLLWKAPALIVTHVSKLVDSPGVDVGLSAMQMVLMAEALGLGTCFLGLIVMAAEHSPELKKALLIPENHRIVTAFVTGYPDISYLKLVSRKTAKVRWL